jgi:EPS-associated MarR family transcriptional regulator
MLTNEYRYKFLSKLNADPSISQRKLASELGISLGKVNFCLKALVDVGLIKVENFRNSQNKSSYLYLLTPKGIEQKANITKKFLMAKIEEHDCLAKEIAEIQQSL